MTSVFGEKVHKDSEKYSDKTTYNIFRFNCAQSLTVRASTPVAAEERSEVCSLYFLTFI